MTNDQELRTRAAAIFPNGMYGHLSVKQLPDNYPQFFESAAGTRLIDANGKSYIDYMAAWGPNLFGYGETEINAAYIAQMQHGDTMVGPSPLAVDLGEALIGMISHADWAIFCKNGTDATTAALMIAREHTSLEKIVVARGSYHGATSWCVVSEAGTSAADRDARLYCNYNDVASLEQAVSQAGGKIAAIFATPHKHDVLVDQQQASMDYARRCRELCDATGALLVVDDIRGGFRTSRDCSWEKLAVRPDLSAYGKAICNGHPISALVGSDKCRAAAGRVFLTGTFWYQAAPMAAALVVLRKIRETDYLERIQALGHRLRNGLTALAKSHDIGFRQSGPETMPLFLFDDDDDLKKGFFWCAEMADRGIYLHPWHNMFINAAMTETDIDTTLIAADAAFTSLKAVLPDVPSRQYGHVQPTDAGASE